MNKVLYTNLYMSETFLYHMQNTWYKIFYMIYKTRDPLFVTKCDTNYFTLSLLIEKLHKVDWGFLNTNKDPNEAYKTVLGVFSNRHEISLPKIKRKLNSKT